jgi:hypothetical protein
VVFVRGRLIRRDDDAAVGRVRLGIDGELDGDADMRVSMSVPSSSGFLFLLADMVLGGEENAAGLLAWREDAPVEAVVRTGALIWEEMRSEETRGLRGQDAVHRCSGVAETGAMADSGRRRGRLRWWCCCGGRCCWRVEDASEV